MAPGTSAAVLAQALHHAGILVEAEDHVAEQVGRRLVARNQ